MRVLFLLPLIPACALLLNWSAEPASVQAEEAKFTFERDVVYATAGAVPLTLNLARPATASGPLPAVLLLHGGGWSAGKKEQLDGLARFLGADGFVAVTSMYRLAPQHPWPAQIQDARQAVRWMRTEGARYGIDPTRIAAMGFSAGGHLALLLGTTDGMDGMDGLDGLEGTADARPVSARVQTAISYFGPTDMEQLPGGGSGSELRQAVGMAALTTLLGPAFRADPGSMSPIRYVDRGASPMLLFQGTRDPLVPSDQAHSFLNRLTESGVPGKVVFIAGAGHGWRDPELGDCIETSLRWLNRYLRPERWSSRTAEIQGR